MIYATKLIIENSIPLPEGRSLAIFFYDKNYGARIVEDQKPIFINNITNREVFLLNKDQTVVWQIKDLRYSFMQQGRDVSEYDDHSYTEIRKENNEYYAFTWSGFKLKINMDNGDVEYHSWSK